MSETTTNPEQQAAQELPTVTKAHEEAANAAIERGRDFMDDDNATQVHDEARGSYTPWPHMIADLLATRAALAAALARAEKAEAALASINKYG